MKPAGVILAAGASARMGRPKALLTLGGVTFVERAIRLLEPLCGPLVVVVGYHREEILASLAGRGGVRVAVNEDPARGMLSSLQCGLAAAGQCEGGAMFTVVDCPAVRAETARAVLAAFRGRGVAVAVPVYGGRRGHPVCVSVEVARELGAAQEGEQARDVIARRRTAESVVDVDDAGVVTDADEPGDLAAIEALPR